MPVAAWIFALAIFVGIDILRCPLGNPEVSIASSVEFEQVTV
jgi:hypothetical protein